MTSPLLSDSVDRVIRDMDRKLAWEDRIIGAMRLCLSQGVQPVNLAKGAALAARYYAIDSLKQGWGEGAEQQEIADCLKNI
jgi:mannitol-1-phosphate/altronate dehydrogenase